MWLKERSLLWILLEGEFGKLCLLLNLCKSTFIPLPCNVEWNYLKKIYIFIVISSSASSSASSFSASSPSSSSSSKRYCSSVCRVNSGMESSLLWQEEGQNRNYGNLVNCCSYYLQAPHEEERSGNVSSSHDKIKISWRACRAIRDSTNP